MGHQGWAAHETVSEDLSLSETTLRLGYLW